MKLTEQQISVAVDWWAERLRHPSFRTLSRAERADPGSQPAAFAEMLAYIGHQPVDEGAVGRFKEALRGILESDTHMWLFLGVDYDPDFLLSQALEVAGIPVSKTVLPWKTGMRFSNGGVQVSEGYGRPYTELLNGLSEGA